MSKQYLDKDGVGYLWQKIKSLGGGLGICGTGEATTAKVATLSSYALVTGGIVSVKFTYAVPANATLNINSRGAKAIYYRGSAITAGVIKAGDTASFIYDGTRYQLINTDAIAQSGSATLTATDDGQGNVSLTLI